MVEVSEAEEISITIPLEVDHHGGLVETPQQEGAASLLLQTEGTCYTAVVMVTWDGH